MAAPRSRTVDRPTPPRPLVATFGEAVRLIGYGLDGEWRPGGQLRLVLYWQALGATERPLTVFTHVLDSR